MQRRTKYQNSVCKGNFLHKWLTIKYTEKGELVRCERCGDKMHLRQDMPRHIILSFMIRSVIQESDPLYKREFPNVII